MKDYRTDGDEMAIKIKAIIKETYKDEIEYQKCQESYIRELKDMRKRVENGECVDTSAIKKAWYESGLTDKNGKIKDFYRKG